LSEREGEILEAYSAGVNRYIETHLKSLPLEFRLLGYEPEPWRPEDSLSLGKGFAFFLSTSLFTRIAWIALADGLKNDPEKLKSLLPRYPSDGPGITRRVAADARGLYAFMSATSSICTARPPSAATTGWSRPVVLSGARSRATTASQARAASTWYPMHLRAGGGEPGLRLEVGGSILGIPCVHVGRNRRIAWG
jgi:penicillin amidase